MPYLICNKCEIFYEIDSDFNFSDLNTCQKCGENLKYYENFDEYYKETNLNSIGENKSSNADNFDIESKYLNYNNYINP